MSERLDAAWKALEQDAAEPNISMAEYQRRFARHRSLIEAEARADAHLHDGCFERGTLTADYIQKARADALDVVRKRFADAFMVHPTGRMTDVEVLAIIEAEAEARADALDIEALMAWAEEREREVRADSDWPFSGAYANAFRDEFIPKLRAILAERQP